MLKIHETAYVFKLPGFLNGRSQKWRPMAGKVCALSCLQDYRPAQPEPAYCAETLRDQYSSMARVLAVLKDNGRMNISQIVERTIIEQPTVSRIVDQLEHEGLAFRESCDEDSRFVHK